MPWWMKLLAKLEDKEPSINTMFTDMLIWGKEEEELKAVK
jgi:hypothetical protein